MLGICKTFGMKLKFVSRAEYQDKQKMFEQYKTQDSYFIDEGGRGALAAKGCEEMVKSIEGYSHVICALGTGTTFSGIVNGMAKKGIRAEGICVLKGYTGLDNEVAQMIKTTDCNWTIHHRFHEGGYAKSTPELLAFIDAFASATGILLDQVYTGKMMLAIVKLIKEKHFKPNDKLLLIHTGGLIGMLTRYQKG
jgi:1-aminocyclopropane-1-carboxylate deaminase